ncbi:MAG: methyltransferase domain-containing protein, partial [Anaerolineales bacterium]|nr:methyltransferase domain-containing protein [Anaerolineales bacterium]
MKPVKRSKQAARQNYDRLSRWYDLIAGSSEAKYRQIGLQALAACPGERVLEIGFGTGHALQDLAESVGANGQVIGIDLSAGMAQRTQARLKKSDPALMPSLLLADGA